jgi:hypothetical protein
MVAEQIERHASLNLSQSVECGRRAGSVELSGYGNAEASLISFGFQITADGCLVRLHFRARPRHDQLIVASSNQLLLGRSHFFALDLGPCCGASKPMCQLAVRKFVTYDNGQLAWPIRKLRKNTCSEQYGTRPIEIRGVELF